MSQPMELKGTAAEICQRFEPSEKARKLLRPGLSPREFLRLVEADHLYLDGIRFSAYALPSRGAIWWGCLCLWSIYRPKPPEKIAAALNSVVAWVQEPDEEKRRAAEAVIAEAGMGTPAGGLAAAVFYSGDNIAPPGQPEVKPKPFLWSKVLAGALAMAPKLVAPDKKKEYERQYLNLAIDVAEMRTHWDPRTSQGEVIVRSRRRS
jgi:hypothetical protein